MATSDKCPRCYCEGNRFGCEICFYSEFKCPGNCKCCADQKESSTQRQAITSNSNSQRDSTQRQVRVSNSNDHRESTQQRARASNRNYQRESTQKLKRPPLRPLILRNVKKAMADSQKAACSNASQSKAASSSVFQSKVGSSKASDPCTNKVNSTVDGANENKVNSAVKESNPDKVNPSVKQRNKVMVNAETQTPMPQVRYVVEPEPPAFGKEPVKNEKEERKHLWDNPFWPQWDKVPCEPHIPHPNENQRRKSNIITKEKLEEGINELIGDHCLNCHCRNPRDPCEICRRTDYQCLGSCLCCLSFRAGQRIMIFITRGLFLLSDGSIYGGGSVNLSLVVPCNSEVTEDKSKANNQILNLSKAVTATDISAFFKVIFRTLNRIPTIPPGMLMNEANPANLLLDSEV